LATEVPIEGAADEARTLWLVLAINAVMFVVELTAGWLAESTGLLADSLDMLADAAVYGLSLYAVGRPALHRRRAARFAGLVQLSLALGAFGEVARRALLGSTPEPITMMSVALLALAANVTCLVLVGRHRHGGVHMKASWIFSANDVIANLGVIVGGALVAWSGSRLPDLIVGSAVAAVVLAGAIRILRLR
jgi:Co/Zn/Cd efflux system component